MFAVNLKRLMIKNQVKVTQLANDMQVGASTVYGWLSGNFSPSKNRKEMIAEYFNINVEELEREDEDMDKELMKNGSGYVDPTAGKALTNVSKDDLENYCRGEIFEYYTANGVTKNALVVSANSRSKDTLMSVVLLDETEKGGYSVPIVCGTKMYANCNTLSYGQRHRFGSFIKRATDEEMEEIDKAIIDTLDLELPHGDEDLGTVMELKKQLANAHETIERQMIEVNKATAERDEAKKDVQYFQHYAETYKEQIAELNVEIGCREEEIRELKAKGTNNTDVARVTAERDLYKTLYEQMLERLIAR